MSDIKSKMPDLKELASMSTKLFNDIKTSVVEIIKDYKEHREPSESESQPENKKPESEQAKSSEKE